MTHAHQDTKVCAILEQLGAEGYGIYWLLLEHLAIPMDGKSEESPVAEHSIVKWAQICHCSARRMRQFVYLATELRLISAETTPELRQYSDKSMSDRFRIVVPNLLKYRDEYSKRSGQDPDKLRPNTQQNRAEQINTHQNGFSRASKPANTPSVLSSNRFHEFWDKYPLKVGESRTAGVWIGIVTPDNEADVFACLQRYILSDQVSRGVAKNPDNWLHDCARDGWKSQWPQAQQTPSKMDTSRAQSLAVMKHFGEKKGI